MLFVLAVITLAKLQQCQQMDKPGREAERRTGRDHDIEPKNEARSGWRLPTYRGRFMACQNPG